ncbi:MAG: NIPSNAP family protein [Chloroflexi bacterium]|nr:NIPSNAP family protein [Chloroflexota bacterium]
MIHELRIYTIRPGIMAEYLKIVEEIGMAIRKNDYGTLVGAWSTEFGALNEYYHLWSYRDPNERARLRAGLQKAPGWHDKYLAATRGMVVAQRNTILTPDEEVGVRSVESTGNTYEFRTYGSPPGQLNGWLSTFKRSLPRRETHSKLVALWTAEVGGLNAASHLWVYNSLAHRAEVRASMAKDTKLAELRGNGVQSLSTQASVILNPAPFSPLR